MSVLGQSLNLLSSILTILLICPNSDTLLCYSNDPFLTVLWVRLTRHIDYRILLRWPCCRKCTIIHYSMAVKDRTDLRPSSLEQVWESKSNNVRTVPIRYCMSKFPRILRIKRSWAILRVVTRNNSGNQWGGGLIICVYRVVYSTCGRQITGGKVNAYSKLTNERGILPVLASTLHC